MFKVVDEILSLENKDAEVKVAEMWGRNVGLTRGEMWGV